LTRSSSGRLASPTCGGVSWLVEPDGPLALFGALKSSRSRDFLFLLTVLVDLAPFGVLCPLVDFLFLLTFWVDLAMVRLG